MVGKALLVILPAVFVLAVLFGRMARLNNRPVTFLLVGGPYDSESVYLHPDESVFITTGLYAGHRYERCPNGHLHHVASTHDGATALTRRPRCDLGRSR